MIALQNELSAAHNQRDIGKVCQVLIEGDSKRSDADFCGRNSQNKMVVFPKKKGLQPGDYVMVQIEQATSATLKGSIAGLEAGR
ncbi:MAG: TRAM domain-containing protein [Saprospiraceae bacterium]